MSRPFFDAASEVESQIVQASHVLVCLNYDGTLTQFVANPLAATLSVQMERILSSLSQHDDVSLAIVSGRERADLQGRIGIPGLIYAGNHGLEISGPGYVFIEPMAAEYTAALQELAEQLAKKLEPITGVVVENKGLSLSVHYRNVADTQLEEVRHLVHATLASTKHPFVLNTGEKVFEIRPRVYWDKGNALTWIRDKLEIPNALPIYVGDDASDEDAFAALPEAITVKVGDVPETAARYTLGGTAEVRKLLEWLDAILEQKAFHQGKSPGAIQQTLAP